MFKKKKRRKERLIHNDTGKKRTRSLTTRTENKQSLNRMIKKAQNTIRLTKNLPKQPRHNIVLR